MFEGECIGKRIIYNENESKLLERKLLDERGNYTFDTAQKAKKTYDRIIQKLNPTDEIKLNFAENNSHNNENDSIDNAINNDFKNLESTKTKINDNQMDLEYDMHEEKSNNLMLDNN